MVYRAFRSVKSFNLRHSELCWERKVQNPGREQGFCLLYQIIHRDWGSTFYNFLHVATLLLDVLEPLLPRLFPLSLLIRGRLVTSVVPTKHPLVATIPEGYVGINPHCSAIFSSSVNVSGGGASRCCCSSCGMVLRPSRACCASYGRCPYLVSYANSLSRH